MADKLTFKKAERLCGEIRINKLYANGKAFISFPFRVVYSQDKKSETSARVLIGVPKKRFKRAHDRNLLKRRMREAYRLHKSLLDEALIGKEYTLNVALNYVGNEELPYVQIEKKMIEALQKISNKLP